MARFLAGAAACLLMVTGAFLLWQGRAEQAAQLPAPPPPSAVPRAPILPQPVRAPEATPKSREEKRFARADKDDDGLVEAEEMLSPRRKAFAKLDRNGDGRLGFEEWAVKTLDKFNSADRDRSRSLTPAEFAATAPKPAKRKSCSC